MIRPKKKEHTCEMTSRDMVPAAIDIPCEGCEEEIHRAAYHYTGKKPAPTPKKPSAWAEWRAQTNVLMKQNNVSKEYYWAAVAFLILITVGLTLLVVRWLFF
jgi:hypothetical protein